MLEEDPKQDSFHEMIDKLQGLNFSVEGEAILKSMADSIRAALEKGLLLEQIILDERNNVLKKPKDDKKCKKKKRKNSLSSIETEVDMIEDLSKCQAEISSKCSFNETDPLKCAVENYIKKVKPLDGRIKLVDDVISPKKGLIRLVDQSSLLSSKSSSFNDIELSNVEVNYPIQNREKEIDNLTEETNSHLVPKQAEPLNIDNSSHFNTFLDPILQTGEKPHDSFISKINPETPSQISPKLNLSGSSDASILNNPCLTQPEKVHSNNDYQQPTMPHPIIIKSEFWSKNSHTDLILPCNNMPHVTSAEQIHTSEICSEIIEIMDTEENTSKEIDASLRSKLMKYQSSNKVFIKAGQDATEDEVIAVFKGLDIVYCYVINKPNHSIGFISFSSKEDWNKALALNCQFSVGGTLMIVKSYIDKRKGETRYHDSRNKELRRITPILHESLSKKPRISNNSQNSQNNFSGSLNDLQFMTDSDEPDILNVMTQDNETFSPEDSPETMQHRCSVGDAVYYSDNNSPPYNRGSFNKRSNRGIPFNRSTKFQYVRSNRDCNFRSSRSRSNRAREGKRSVPLRSTCKDDPKRKK